MNSRTYILSHATARDNAAKHVWNAPDGYAVRIGEPKRNEEQSAKFHAMCGDVAKQKLFMGKRITKDQWKTLFVSAHAVATGDESSGVPGLEQEYVVLRESTADMGKKRMSSLIEYVLAWAAMQDPPVEWSEHA